MLPIKGLLLAHKRNGPPSTMFKVDTKRTTECMLRWFGCIRHPFQMILKWKPSLYFSLSGYLIFLPIEICGSGSPTEELVPNDQDNERRRLKRLIFYSAVNQTCWWILVKNWNCFFFFFVFFSFTNSAQLVEHCLPAKSPRGVSTFAIERTNIHFCYIQITRRLIFSTKFFPLSVFFFPREQSCLLYKIRLLLMFFIPL